MGSHYLTNNQKILKQCYNNYSKNGPNWSDYDLMLTEQVCRVHSSMHE